MRGRLCEMLFLIQTVKSQLRILGKRVQQHVSV